MRDLTVGSIRKHIVVLAAPVSAGLVFQVLYVLVDLYFVARLGPDAVAGVGAAATISFVVMALTQMVGVGTVALISHAAWWRLLKIGVPAGGEMGLLFVYSGIIYVIIARFGPAAQAGFTVGSRIMQAFFLPVMAIAFAASPIAGQNFGARHHHRVQETLISAVLISSVLMGVVMLLCQWNSRPLIQFFSHDPAVVSFGGEYLRIISWNFIATGIIYSCSSIFQALGNTWPALLSSASRLISFILPILWLASRPGFRVEEVWYLSVTTVALQAATSLVLVRRQMHRARQPALA